MDRTPTQASPAPRPLILIRGFGGLDVAAEQANAYQGYNDGTVYPGRRGDNYIYEGFLLRAMKSDVHRYTDATNVIGYYADDVTAPEDLDGFDRTDAGGRVVIDPAVARQVLGSTAQATMWVYRFYDLSPRSLENYGLGLMRLIKLIRRALEKQQSGSFTGVDIVAHSMGGLVVREALIAMKEAVDHAEKEGLPAEIPPAELVHKIVTLGTPHRGIAFQRVPGWLLSSLPGAKEGSDELGSFDPGSTRFLMIQDAFPITRILTVVGTNHKTYGVRGASLANRISSLVDEGSLTTNRSDGLVKQSAAQLPGAPRTFVHKCHGGLDSLVTSREAYEIAMRFFHGSHRIRLWLDSAEIQRGQDWFGDSEFYFGVTIKPRYVDFELFHQSPEAENCYGPFSRSDLGDDLPDLEHELRRPLADAGDRTTGWAGPGRLVWEGWVDATARPGSAPGLVFRLDIYVGERDSRGLGFSDNVIFRKQYYVQAFPGTGPGSEPLLFLHTGEKYLGRRNPRNQEELAALAAEQAEQSERESDADVRRLQRTDGGHWLFEVVGTGFRGTFRVAVDRA
jgi:pimeloyl-ACP methyl ester carboxylesterase